MEKIAEGGFGAVYKCVDKKSSIQFVCKEPKERGRCDASIVKEVKILETLRHPCIVEYYGFSLEDDGSCLRLFLEYVSQVSCINS